MNLRSSETGAVLLTTLLIMAVMAALSVALMDTIRLAVKRTVNVQTYAQTDWYVRGAEDFARQYLTGQIANIPASQLSTALSSAEPVIFPIEGGLISLTVRDSSQCFALSALNEAPGRRQFRQLLEVIGVDISQAARITSAMVDWIDSDSQTLPDGAEDHTYLGQTPAYRTANRDFSSVMELRAVSGMNEALYQALRPFVCVRSGEQAGGLNINGLKAQQAPLLAALLGGRDYTNAALQLITDRPSGGYTDIEQVLAAPIFEDVSLKNANFEALIFSPEHIWIEADIRYRDARRYVVLDYAIQNQRVQRVYRRLGDEARRPILVDSET